MLSPLLLSALLHIAAVAQPTTNISGPKPGSSASKIPVGKIIRSCTVPNSFALTFDDGPFEFTSTLLDLLKNANLKATFFVNGDNYSKISERKDEVQRMLSEGHQIGSHTFKHPDLRNLSDAEVRKEMTLLDAELKKLVGKTPTYMRPPYFRTTNETLKVMGEMEYHVINADLDTLDWQNNKPETNDKSFQRFKDLFGNGTISLMHDVYNTTVNQLVPNVIPFLEQSGRTSMTVGECLGDPKENWYRDNTPRESQLGEDCYTTTGGGTLYGEVGYVVIHLLNKDKYKARRVGWKPAMFV